MVGCCSAGGALACRLLRDALARRQNDRRALAATRASPGWQRSGKLIISWRGRWVSRMDSGIVVLAYAAW
jgi:hypothetical protein